MQQHEDMVRKQASLQVECIRQAHELKSKEERVRLQTLHNMQMTQIKQHWMQKTRLAMSKQELDNSDLQQVLGDAEQLSEEVENLESEVSRSLTATKLKLDSELRQDLLSLKDSLKKQKEAALFKI